MMIQLHKQELSSQENYSKITIAIIIISFSKINRLYKMRNKNYNPLNKKILLIKCPKMLLIQIQLNKPHNQKYKLQELLIFKTNFSYYSLMN